MDVPTAPKSILGRAIIVYPETVSGNPLGGLHVVRWLLHKRGYLRPATTFSPNELTFYINQSFIEGDCSVDPDNELRIRWIRDDVFFDQGRQDRRGACRMLRTAKTGNTAAPEADDAILVDGMSHTDMADVFNRTEIFYCHDPYTMYCYYAARCGCLPIVVPIPGVSVERWRPLESERWGMAYGIENSDWAKRTRGLMLQRVERERENEIAMVERFARKLAAALG